MVTMQQVADYLKAGAAELGPHMANVAIEADEGESMVYLADEMWSLGRVEATRLTLGGATRIDAWQVYSGEDEDGVPEQNLWAAASRLLTMMARQIIEQALEAVPMPGAIEEEQPTGDCPGCGRSLWGGETECGACRQADELAGLRMLRDSGATLSPTALAMIARYEAELEAAMGPAGDFAYDTARERAAFGR